MGVINPNVSATNLSSFKYKSSLSGEATVIGTTKEFNDIKTVVPLKYLSSVFRSLEMLLINCKIHSNWTKDCVMSNIAGETAFKRESTKLFVPIVTLSNKDNVNLTKQLSEGLNRSLYWNEYKSKTESKNAGNSLTRFYLDASFQGVTKLFMLAFDNANLANGNDSINKFRRNSHRKYFLPRVSITDGRIDGRNFYDQPINEQIKNYDEIRKIATGQ